MIQHHCYPFHGSWVGNFRYRPASNNGWAWYFRSSLFRNLANNSILAPQRWGSDTVQQEVSKCLSQVWLPRFCRSVGVEGPKHIQPCLSSADRCTAPSKATGQFWSWNLVIEIWYRLEVAETISGKLMITGPGSKCPCACSWLESQELEVVGQLRNWLARMFEFETQRTGPCFGYAFLIHLHWNGWCLSFAWL